MAVQKVQLLIGSQYRVLEVFVRPFIYSEGNAANECMYLLSDCPRTTEKLAKRISFGCLKK